MGPNFVELAKFPWPSKQIQPSAICERLEHTARQKTGPWIKVIRGAMDDCNEVL